MDFSGRVQVSVSRSIAAPAAKIFQVLADPANHPALDGSGLLRATSGQAVPSRAGDTFTMAMFLPELGDYLMLNRVIAFEQDRRIAWEPTPGDIVASRNAGLPVGASQGYSWGFRLQPDGDKTIVTEVFDCTEADQSIRDAVEDGQTWIPAMHTTLDRLAVIVEQP
jgi:RNA polymerase sigma-70 factor, ECF subfamily